MKRSIELRELSREHHAALVLAKACIHARELIEKEKIDAMCAEVMRVFGKSLIPHFKFEEEHLLPRLNEMQQFVLVERTLKEHNDLRAIAQNISLHADASSLVAFGRLMIDHVHFEEREMFPCYEKIAYKQKSENGNNNY